MGQSPELQGSTETSALRGGQAFAPTEPGEGLVFRVVFVLLTLLGIAPVWITDLLPLLDAASHQHLIRLIHEYETSALIQHHYEQVHAIVPYLTYYKAVDWLMYVVDVEIANRVVLSLCLAALPMAAVSLLRAIGHSRWLVLGVFPWMLNSDFFMGFFNYLMSIPLFLWILAAHIRLLRAPAWPAAVAVAALAVALALTHYLLWAATLWLLPLLALLYGLRRRGARGAVWLGREIALLLPSVLVLYPWFRNYFVLAQGPRTADQAVIAATSWRERISQLYSGQHLGPIDDLKQLFSHMFDNYVPAGEHLASASELLQRRQGEVTSALWLLGIALWIVGAAKRHRGGEPVETSPALGTSYAGTVFALMLLFYFALPQHLARPIYLYGVDFRLTEVLGVLAVIAVPVCPLRAPEAVQWRVWLGTALLSIVAVMVPLHAAGTFLLVRTEYGSVREAFGSIPPGRNVLTLRYKRNSRWLREAIFSNIGEYYVVFQGGYVPYSFADSSSKPIVSRGPPRTMPAPVWFDHNTYSFEQHGQYYDYVVIYRDLDERTGSWERSLAGWDRIYQRDYWQVYRNPAPTAWPPPTPQEVARKAVQERLLRWPLVAAGLDDATDMPATLDALLLDSVAALRAAGVGDAAAAPEDAGAGRRRRRPVGVRGGDAPPGRDAPAVAPDAAGQRRPPDGRPPAPPAEAPAAPGRSSERAPEEPAAQMPSLPTRLPVFQRQFGRMPAVVAPAEAGAPPAGEPTPAPPASSWFELSTPGPAAPR